MAKGGRCGDLGVGEGARKQEQGGEPRPLYRLQGVNFPELRAGGRRDIVWEVSPAGPTLGHSATPPGLPGPHPAVPTLTPQVLDPRSL